MTLLLRGLVTSRRTTPPKRTTHAAGHHGQAEWVLSSEPCGLLLASLNFKRGGDSPCNYVIRHSHSREQTFLPISLRARGNTFRCHLAARTGDQGVYWIPIQGPRVDQAALITHSGATCNASLP